MLTSMLRVSFASGSLRPLLARSTHEWDIRDAGDHITPGRVAPRYTAAALVSEAPKFDVHLAELNAFLSEHHFTLGELVSAGALLTLDIGLTVGPSGSRSVSIPARIAHDLAGHSIAICFSAYPADRDREEPNQSPEPTPERPGAAHL